MGPIAYSLCQKEMLGVAMWITGLCSFPPLVPEIPVSLQTPGLVLEREFKAPVEKSYMLGMRFFFPSTEARLEDKLVGEGGDGQYCRGEIPYERIPIDKRTGLGLPIPFKVVVREKASGALVAEHTFESLCNTSHATNDKGRDVGRITLKEGSYRIEVHNLKAQPAFKDIKVVMGLYPGRGK